jgi:hypothetical protein
MSLENVLPEPGELTGPRKNRMTIRQAQAELLALIPEIESLAARFQAISDNLEAREPTDRFVFGRPGRESLRYSVAGDAALAADELGEVLVHARRGSEETHARLLARWEKDQKEESEGHSRYRHSRELVAVGG